MEAIERHSSLRGRDSKRKLAGRKLVLLKELWLGGRDSNPDAVVQSRAQFLAAVLRPRRAAIVTRSGSESAFILRIT